MRKGKCNRGASRRTQIVARAAWWSVAAGVLHLLPGAVAWGVSGQWTQTNNGGLWSGTGNWLNGNVANGTGFTADFSELNITAEITAHLDSARSIGYVFFGDTTPSNDWTLDNNGNAANTLTLAVNSGAPEIGVNNETATVSAVLAGTQGMTKLGAGTLTLAGSSANTYTGTTTVSAGTLILNKTANVAAIPGDLVIGSSTGAANSVVVQLQANDEISASSNVTVNSSGLLNLNGNGDFIGGITLAGGNISTGTGVLETASITLTSVASSTTGTISGHIDMLDGQQFSVAAGTTSSGIDLDLQAVVTDGFLEKSGAGLLNLSGNNTFTNGVTIDAGVVRLANAGALNSTTPNAVTFSASSTGTLRLNGNSVTISGLSTDATTPGTPVVENANSTAATLTINNASDGTYAGVIQDGTGGGALSLTKTGAGTLTLSGTSANTYTGTTTVNSGTLLLNNSVSGGNGAIPGNLVIGNSTDAAGSAVVRDLAGGQISDGSNITVNKSGLLDLNGFTELVGNLTLVGGAISTGTGGNIFVNGEVDSSSSSTTATISGDYYLFGFTTFNVTAGTTPSGIDLDMQSVVSGGFLTKTGNGVLNLSGNNTFSGGLHVDAGVVRLANAGALNSTTPNAVTFDASSTGTLRLNGNSVTISGLSTDATTPGTPTVENASSTAATLTINNASDGTYAGVIQDGTGGGALSLTKTGAGTLTLGGTTANTYTGTTTVSAGTLVLDKPVGTPAVNNNLIIGGSTGAANSVVVRELAGFQIAGSVTVNSSGLLDLNGNNEYLNFITLAGGTISTGAGSLATAQGTLYSVASATTGVISGNLNLFGPLNFDVAAGTTSSGIDLDIQAVASDGSLSKSNNGLLNLSGNNTFTDGVTINAGVLRLANAGALNSTTPNAVTFGTSSTGTLRLNGTSVTISGLSTDPTTPGTPTVENASSTAAALTINNASDGTYAGVIQDGTGGGALSLTKTGASTLTLSGTNTYTGGTTVSAGTLILAATGALPLHGALSVSDGALAAVANHGTGSKILLQLGSLSITGTGQLDLSNNDMILQNTTASTLQNELKAGFNAGHGYWNGTGGMISTAAATDTRHLTTLGYRTGGSAFDGINTTTNDVLVKYTYYGDADLNGTVNGADYQQIDNGFGSHLTGWSNGDFNYDGIVNGSDFALIDNTFNQITATAASPLAIVAGSPNLIASSDVIEPTVSSQSVPEPASITFLTIAVAGLSMRRKRSTGVSPV